MESACRLCASTWESSQEQDYRIQGAWHHHEDNINFTVRTTTCKELRTPNVITPHPLPPKPDTNGRTLKQAQLVGQDRRKKKRVRDKGRKRKQDKGRNGRSEGRGRRRGRKGRTGREGGSGSGARNRLQPVQACASLTRARPPTLSSYRQACSELQSTCTRLQNLQSSPPYLGVWARQRLGTEFCAEPSTQETWQHAA